MGVLGSSRLMRNSRLRSTILCGEQRCAADTVLELCASGGLDCSWQGHL